MLERLVDFFRISNQFLLVHRCDYTNLTVVIQGMINMTGKAPGLVVGSSGNLASQIAAGLHWHIEYPADSYTDLELEEGGLVRISVRPPAVIGFLRRYLKKMIDRNKSPD